MTISTATRQALLRSTRPLPTSETLPVERVDAQTNESNGRGRGLEGRRIGWAARSLPTVAGHDQNGVYCSDIEGPLRSGDVVAVRVVKPGQHRALVTQDNRRMRLYRDDELVGVVGARYASDAFESEITTGESIHLVTASGMCSTVCEKHGDTAEPTQLQLLGTIRDSQGKINLIDRQFRTRRPVGQPNVILMLGSGMNAGKTTTSRRLVKALLRAGLRVAACKLTGSVSHRDLFEYEATQPHDVRDFSHYGFPSTYGCSREQVEQLFFTMVSDAERVRPDVIVMEVADGVLQPETWALLESAKIRSYVKGTILSAPCSLSSLEGTRRIAATGHQVLAVSGIISNSPLMVREFRAHSDFPVVASSGQAVDLASCVLEHLAGQHAAQEGTSPCSG